MHDAILRGVERRLPESLLHAVNRAKGRRASIFEEHYNWQKASFAEVVTTAKDTLTTVNDQATRNVAYSAELQGKEAMLATKEAEVTEEQHRLTRWEARLIEHSRALKMSEFEPFKAAASGYRVATRNSIGPVLDSQNPLWSQETALPSKPQDSQSLTLDSSLPTLYSAFAAAPLASQDNSTPSSQVSPTTRVFINDSFDCVPEAAIAAMSPDIAITSKLSVGCVKSLTPIRNSSLTAESAPTASDRSFSDQSAADTSSEDDVVHMPSSVLRFHVLPCVPLAKQRYSTQVKASSANPVSLVAECSFPLQAQKLKTASSFSQHSANENFSFKTFSQVASPVSKRQTTSSAKTFGGSSAHTNGVSSSALCKLASIKAASMKKKPSSHSSLRSPWKGSGTYKPFALPPPAYQVPQLPPSHATHLYAIAPPPTLAIPATTTTTSVPP
ncbi:hypothetical protein ABBQ32_006571 [Trebouxia sp. C0010 RCD-2024]